ncbi:Plasma membrane ATPase [Mucor velutinosus]|uniref:Plasma membrane ATPase n=1 Tax=Mucor velutinosus TaxID=708070 RepID=A0AAN7HQI8_9FUNG|nr:Plasma membrane ATPase [Mucor velutinosus]
MSLSRNLSLYRGLLREVNIQYTKAANNPTFAQELKSIYRNNQHIQDPSKIEALNSNAENVLTFLTSSRKHKELRALYSAIVMEQKRKIELSANRVGLNLPKQYDPENPQPLGGNAEEAAASDKKN